MARGDGGGPVVCRGYIRVSTEEQALEGYSLDAQADTIREASKKQGWVLAEIYADEGKSGKSMKKRPGLQRLLTDIRGGEVLIMWKLDRMNRNLHDSETIFKQLDAQGAAFYSIAEPHLSNAGAGAKFSRQMMAAFAEYYSGQLGENVRHGMIRMVKEGRWTGGPVPIGYSLVDGTLTPNNQAAIVREIFATYLQGIGVRTMVDILNRRGSRTPRGAQWSPHSISHILRNPIYAGYVAFGKVNHRRHVQAPENIVMAPGRHEPIIEPETWHQVQTVIARRKTIPARQATGKYPLTGIARCGLCGAAISGAQRLHGRTTRVRRREYRCRARQHNKTCTMQNMLAEKLEAAFLGAVRQLMEPGAMAAAVGSADVQLPSMLDDRRRDLNEVERKLARWDTAFEAGSIDLPDFTAKVKPLRAQRKGLLDEIAQLERRHSGIDSTRLAELAGSICETWEHATPAERKELVHQLCSRVTVYPKYVLSITLRVEG